MSAQQRELGRTLPRLPQEAGEGEGEGHIKWREAAVHTRGTPMRRLRHLGTLPTPHSTHRLSRSPHDAALRLVRPPRQQAAQGPPGMRSSHAATFAYRMDGASLFTAAGRSDLPTP